MKSFAVAFKSVYEKGLMKYGFKKIKGSRPYYVRCVGDEIVHVITFQDRFTYHQGRMGVFDKAFVVLFGAATVYREKIAFDELPKDNTEWLRELSTICYKENYYPAYDRSAYEEMIPYKFEYSPADESSMMSEIEKSFALTEKYALPILDKLTTLEECLKHFFKYRGSLTAVYETSDAYIKGSSGGWNNEGLLCTAIYAKDRMGEYEKAWKQIMDAADEDELYRINAGLSGFTMEQHEANKLQRQEDLKEMLRTFDVLANTPKWQEKIRRELEERKNNNIEILRNYGLEI